MKGLFPFLVFVGGLPVGFSQVGLSEGETVADEATSGGLPSILDYPAFQAAQVNAGRQVVRLVKAKEFAMAEKVLRGLEKRFPQSAASHYNLACLLALTKRPDEAFACLERSVGLGFRNPGHLRRDPDLAALRADERFAEVLAAATEPYEGKTWPSFPKPEPAAIRDGEALVTEKNLGYDPRSGLFLVPLRSGEGGGESPVSTRKDEVGERLRQWFGEGTAAGNHGDFYDNHDADHSNMNFRACPQLTRIEYGAAIRGRRLHSGWQGNFLFDGIVLGNSSTALTQGPNWRSQARFAMTRPNGAAKLALHYARNHLYFYPEHKDHDIGRDGKDGGGYGDVFPANVPYLVVSQGSSGSDRAFMDAFAAALAALRPEVKETLARNGLLMSTLQAVFRRSNRNVKVDEDYFAGQAHPTVFAAANLDPLAMVRRAHELRADSLPPLARFQVIREDEPVIDRDFFDFLPHQRLFDTPCAVARVYKSSASALHFTLDASASRDLHDRLLRYRWEILRGDAERIDIKKANANGSVVDVMVPWHERRPVTPGSKLESNRVDLALFVSSGGPWSAPAFFSVYCPDNQKRIYDDRGRPLSIDYSLRHYHDPFIEHARNWRDEYHYHSETGELLGWTRHRQGQDPQEFTPEGRLVLTKDENGDPTKTSAVRYLPGQGSGNKIVVRQVVVEE